jgi:hypothetical protein
VQVFGDGSPQLQQSSKRRLLDRDWKPFGNNFETTILLFVSLLPEEIMRQRTYRSESNYLYKNCSRNSHP